MTVSEFAFLALGLVLGVVSGAALIVISTARPPAMSEIRLTVTPNAIPRRNRSTLSEDAFADHAEPARGGPADRYQDDLDDLYAPAWEPPGTRTIVRSAPQPPAGAGDPESGAPGPVRPGRGSPWPAAATNRAPLPASIVASYPPGPSWSIPPLVAVPIVPEPDLAMAALRASAARSAEALMRAHGGTITAAPPRWHGGLAPMSVASVAMNGAGNGSSSPGESARGSIGDVADGPAEPYGPCGEAERVAEERCAVAARAREHAEATQEAVRMAQGAFEEHAANAERAALAADQRGMRVAKETAQQAFRRARAVAATRDAIEAAARDWLTEINRINQGARDAGIQLQRERQAANELVETLERLTVEADAARAAAQAAEATCEVARAAVAECHEALPGERTRTLVPPVTSYPMAAIGAAPVDATDETSPLETAFAATGANEPAILGLLRGDHATFGRLVERLAGTDLIARRRWQLALAGLVDAVVATSIESSILAFPPGHPFWGGFTLAQSRDIAAALASLGFRFDGLGGWADERIPSQRDLSLAAGYAGLDPMRIRRWPTEAEAAELYRDVRVAADEYLTGAARGLTLGELVSALGRRADALTDVWNEWDRVRPLLLAGV